MTTKLDRNLKQAITDWRKICPESMVQVDDLRKAVAACSNHRKKIAAVVSDVKKAGKGSSPYDDFTDKDLKKLLTEVENYTKGLQKQQKIFSHIKTWLSRVRSSKKALPCSFVVEGNMNGMLHVDKHESAVKRASQVSRGDIAGSRIYAGTCSYTGGKLVFDFEGSARAQWRPTLQKIVGKAGLNMKVALAGSGENTAEEGVGANTDDLKQA